MSKLTINLASESAAANPYLSADGLVDIAALAKLAVKITAANKAAHADKLALAKNPATFRAPKVVIPMLYTRKPLVKFQASLDKKNDHKYKLQRGQLIKSRTKLPAADSRVKLVQLLPFVYEGVPKDLVAAAKKAVMAANSHNRKATSMVGKVKTEKGKMRDAANKTFDKSIDMLTTVLNQAGFNTDKDVVLTTGMMGKTVLLRLGKDNVVSIGKADPKRFAAAVRASKTAE